MRLFVSLILAISVIALAACSSEQATSPSTAPANTIREETTINVPAETPEYPATSVPIETPSHSTTTTPFRGIPLYQGAEEMPTPSGVKEQLNISGLSCRTYRVRAKLADVITWYKNLKSSYILFEEVQFSPPDNPEVKNSMLYYRHNGNGVLVAVLHERHAAGGVSVIIAEGPWSTVETSGIRENPRDGQTQPPQCSGEMLYEIYPLTDDAPVLELYWGPPDLSMDNIARFTPYGIWESPYEPAVEMQFYTFSSHDPVYTPCAPAP